MTDRLDPSSRKRPRRGERTADTVDPDDSPPAESVWVSAGAVAAVLALSLVVGVISSLYATQLLDLGPVHLSVGAVIAGVFDSAGGLLAGWALRSRDAIVLPGLGWFVGLAVLVFVPTGGGDTLVPGTGDDVYAFLVAGVAGTAVAGLVGYRDLLLRPRATPRA